MVAFALVLVGLVLFDVLALRFGADSSRDVGPSTWW